MIKKKLDISEIFEDLNEGVRNEDFGHHEVMEVFKEFIDETLLIKVELELTQQDIQKLKAASLALKAASEVRI